MFSEITLYALADRSTMSRQYNKWFEEVLPYELFDDDDYDDEDIYDDEDVYDDFYDMYYDNKDDYYDDFSYSRNTVRKKYSKYHRYVNNNYNISDNKNSDCINIKEQHLNKRIIKTKLVGVTYNNNDGINRQSILAKLNKNSKLHTSRYFFSNEPAIAVLYENSIIGHVPKTLANQIYEEYPLGVINVTLTAITGGTGTNYYGCNVELQYTTSINSNQSSHKSIINTSNIILVLLCIFFAVCIIRGKIEENPNTLDTTKKTEKTAEETSKIDEIQLSEYQLQDAIYYMPSEWKYINCLDSTNPWCGDEDLRFMVFAYGRFSSLESFKKSMYIEENGYKEIHLDGCEYAWQLYIGDGEYYVKAYNKGYGYGFSGKNDHLDGISFYDLLKKVTFKS